VLVTPANFRDPDKWTAFSPAASVRDRLFREFKKVAGSADRCPKDPEKSIPFAYTAANVVVDAAYRDRAGRVLIALQLDARLNSCDGLPGDEWSAHWFLLDNGIHVLGVSLELVDAGDYDADGKSEVLFWSSGYNEDGYVLFYDGFARHEDFFWSYH
jgi:hypothetical protein